MRKDPPDPTGPGGGHGYTLGGGAGGAAGEAGGTQQLSPEEVRARRLAALGGGGGGAAAAASSSENAGASAAAGGGSGDDRHVRFGAVSEDDGRLPSAGGGGGGGANFFAPSGGDSDDDDDLQRALALSLMESNASNTGSGSAADALMDLGSIPDAEVVLASSAFDDNGSNIRRSVGNRPPTPSPADERKPAAAAAAATASSSAVPWDFNAVAEDWIHSGNTTTCVWQDGRPIPMDEYYRDDGDRKMPAKKTAEEGKAEAKSKAPPVPAKVENVVVHISSDDKPSVSASVSKSYAESVHSLLWNDAVTTDGDKERWRGQGIDTTPSMWADIGGGEPDDDNDTVSTVASSADGDHATAAAASAAPAAAAASAGSNPNDAAADGNNNDDNNNDSENNPPNTNNANPISDALGTKHYRWGLTQVHGGPCGVLAAVQAEMLRMLLFGRRKDGADNADTDGTTNNNNSNSDSSDNNVSNGATNGLSRIKTYPRTAGGDEDSDEGETIQATSPPTVEVVREAMALAIGTILARAALAPPATESEKQAEEKSKEEGWVKVGAAGSDSGNGKKRNGDDENDDANDTTTNNNFCGVRIVLPTQPIVEPTDDGATAAATSSADLEPMDVDTESTPANGAAAATATANGNAYNGLTWDMLSSFHAGANGSDTMPQLRVCTISISPESNLDDVDGDGLGPESKRQRKNSIGDGSSVVQCEDSIEGRVACLATIVAKYLLETGDSTSATGESATEPAPKHSALQYFSADGGVLLLVLSLLESRGLEKVKSDMDDSSSTLTSQFGHSSQELINLLLTGQAVSNVFDNHVDMGGGLICRGVQSQPAIGYLTQLESHRYCEVGGYYKSPTFPIWLVGSTGHFSVLFGDSRCMIESSSDKLLEKCRRAFRAVDGGEDNGFIQVSSLGEVMRSLDLYDQIGADGLQTLKASLEVHGAGIILWSDWWKVASRLLCGASLQSVLQGDDPAKSDEPLLLTQFGESGGAPAAAAAAPAAAPSSQNGGDSMLSDEELARKLAAEWGTAPEPAPAAAASASSGNAHKSDEELARELQAQWNSDLDMPPLERADNIGNDSKMEAKPSNSVKDQKMEEDTKKPSAATIPSDDDGGSFDMYHYNGLRGGTLTAFRVIKPKSLDAVGSSISMSSHGGTASRDGGDLEDVVRTRWRNCNFDWKGKRAPYID